ncbi:MAG: hypothetical protein AAF696_12835 [Bacteroidota bacterium]
MDFSTFVMYAGFIMAAYSVVGNDVIQTLGTFLSSNEKRPWYVLWIYAGSILTFALVYGWMMNDGDVSYGRLLGSGGFEDPAYPMPSPLSWWYLLPPVVLLTITRFGIPVSTTFLILSFFGTSGVDFSQADGIFDMLVTFFQAPAFSKMLVKSLTGYAVAFGAAAIIYILISKSLEKRFANSELRLNSNEGRIWTAAQWLSTGFLWSQWLIQDFANIYAYLPRKVESTEMIISLGIILGLLAYIFYQRGGAIQGIVLSKSNTTDIRSATIIDFIYGVVLFYFKELNDVPMSTTWVFIGLLAGRELAVRFRLDEKLSKKTTLNLAGDAGKASLGLVVSIFLVILIQILRTS